MTTHAIYTDTVVNGPLGSVIMRDHQWSSIRYLEEYNDCVVIALAIAMGGSYEEAYWHLSKHGRTTREGIGLTPEMEDAFTELGFVREPITKEASLYEFACSTKATGARYMVTLGVGVKESTTRRHAAHTVFVQSGIVYATDTVTLCNHIDMVHRLDPKPIE